ncbi:Tetratricopeptide-like helical domain [Trinorchestia longiramus]|nr:Tetratricopeptide-like helical domain [Trinorchestia longiramus]
MFSATKVRSSSLLSCALKCKPTASAPHFSSVKVSSSLGAVRLLVTATAKRTALSCTGRWLSVGGCLALGSAAVAATVTAEDVSSVLQEADRLYNLGNFSAICELLEPLTEGAADEVLWRLARAKYEVAKASADSKRTAALLREAYAHVTAALAINDSNFAVRKWVAILVDEVAALEGSKARILQSFVMKEHMQRACELNPSDGTSWYLLGMWHYNVAAIPWYQRKAAAVLFATPPASSFKEALGVFLHAEKVEPSFYSQNLLMIGKCYQQLQEKEKASEYLQKAVDLVKSLPQPSRDDQSACKEATELLKAL